MFFRVKWLQPAMKGTSCVRRVCGCGRFCRELFLLCVLQRVVVPVCVVLYAFLAAVGCETHCNGRKPEHETLFFRVKWLQATMKGTSCVRRVRRRSFLSRIVPPTCFATSGCSCVRSSMRFLKLWWQIALEWLLDCRHLMLPRA